MKIKLLFVSTLIILLQVSWIKPPAAAVGKKMVTGTGIQRPPGNFSFFRTHRQGRDGIAASWAVNSAQGITGFILQRTYEYPDEYATWENIYEVNASGSNSYGFLDVMVCPGEINYRVVAVNGTNTAFVSAISSVLIRQR